MVLVRVAVCIALYCIVYCICICLKSASQQIQSTKKINKKSKIKTRSLRYIDTDFRWADSRGIRYNRFYVIANYVISVVTCIHFKWSSAGPRRGLRYNRELRYIGLRYIDSWLYFHVQAAAAASALQRETENVVWPRCRFLRSRPLRPRPIIIEKPAAVWPGPNAWENNHKKFGDHRTLIFFFQL